MKTRSIYAVVILLLGCNPYKRITIKTDTFMSAGKINKYEVYIPKGYIKSSTNMDNYILKEYQYPDSSVFYISLDFSFSNSPNYYNWIKCTDFSKNYKCEEGIQENNKYWKEILSKNLVLGYYNVNKTQIEKFDEAIQSLSLIKKTKEPTN